MHGRVVSSLRIYALQMFRIPVILMHGEGILIDRDIPLMHMLHTPDIQGIQGGHQLTSRPRQHIVDRRRIGIAVNDALDQTVADAEKIEKDGEIVIEGITQFLHCRK